MNHRILIVDDEPALRRALRRYLERQGFEVVEAETVQRGTAAFRKENPDAVILDYSLPDGTALDLIEAVDPRQSGIPIIVLTGHGTIDLAVLCMQQGAENFLTKPPEMKALTTILRRSLESRRNERRALAAQRSGASREKPDPFLGTTSPIRVLKEEARLAVDSTIPVLILGETGTGKGLLAGWLHENSPRSQEAFVDLNCAGLSRDLLESELFGHARGAFTGAVTEKKGLMEVAHRGTLFLDEIGDMDLQVQPKFLTALEEQRFRRLGEVKDRRVDVRLVAATHRNLGERVKEGSFRADLYYRINAIVLVVPSLRERIADVGILAETITHRLCLDMGIAESRLTEGAVSALAEHSWPGNLRELRNVLERALLASRGQEIKRQHLRIETPLGEVAPDRGVATDGSLEEVESLHIQRVLRQRKGSVKEAAEQLGIPRSTLYQKLKVLGIEAGSFRD